MMNGCGDDGNENNNKKKEDGKERKDPTKARPQRHTSVPALKTVNLGELGRQWSTGRGQTAGDVPVSTASTAAAAGFVVDDDSAFAREWATSASSSAIFGNSWATGMASVTGGSFGSFGGASMELSTSKPPPAPPASESPGISIQSLIDENAVTSIIHDEARIVNWDTVLKLCKSHPQHAAYVGPDGWTALHHACNRRCDRADVVEALIHAYPGALGDMEEKGMAPLHYACRFKAPREAVRLLLDLYPSNGHPVVSIRDKRGRTPLWYALRYDAPPGVVEMLLDVDPKAVLEEDKNADGPLSLVWGSWAEKLEGKKTLQPFLNPDENDGTDPKTLLEKIETTSKLKSRWKQANKLLKAAFRFSMVKEKPDGQERTYRVLHATSAIKCHPSLFLLAKALYPGQASEADENDLYPAGETGSSPKQTALHLAAASAANGDAGRAVIRSLLELYPSAAQVPDGTDGGLPLHRIVKNERKHHWALDGISVIFHAYPRAASVADCNGQLPLHCAAAKIAWYGESDGTTTFEEYSTIFNLVQEYPTAASRADKSGCMPLHLVAETGDEWTREGSIILRAFAAAARTRAGPNRRNRLPIHLASANPMAKGTLIEKLVESNPRGTMQADSRGKLPLHLACETGKEWAEGVLAIHESNPAAVTAPEENGRGWTALQLAAACPTASGDLISNIAELNPEAASRKDKRGRFALHLACGSGKGWNGGVKAIFDANPFANISEDKRGLLPFHVAAFELCLASEETDTQEEENETEANTEGKSSKSSEEEEGAIAAVELLFQLLRADPTII